ncbi:MAG: zinc dependent phospholipase C family protein [Ferruginibacter sp.]
MFKTWLYLSFLWTSSSPIEYHWGFYAHALINRQAVFLLPPAMIGFYKSHIRYLEDHAVDPDKRRYLVKEEGPRHYIDLDLYGSFPHYQIPTDRREAEHLYHPDTLTERGIVPWHVHDMLYRLTSAFRRKNKQAVLQISAELGHYVSDAHVPLHASSNHNGQKSDQKGIHGLWETRLPELFAEQAYDFVVYKAAYLSDPLDYIWHRVVESALAADTVLRLERLLSERFDPARKYGYEARKKTVLKQYATAYATAYHDQLDGMVERRMRLSIFSVASFWYTAWVDAGQPNLDDWNQPAANAPDRRRMTELLDASWRNGSRMIGREE